MDDEGYAQLQLASATGRQALGGRPGARTERHATALPFERTDKPGEAHEGWTSLHAGTRIRAADRKGLERLCRYVLRPALPLARTAIDAEDRVTITLRSPWHDGTTALRFDPVDFIGRLATLVPPARQHTVRYHGVLAPAARWRARIVPGRPAPPRPDTDATMPPLPPVRWRRWADLIKRTFGYDPQCCPRCERPMRTMALLRSNARDILAWLDVQGDVLVMGASPRGDPDFARVPILIQR